MGEKSNKKIEEMTLYVKDLSNQKVELKLKSDSIFEDILIALKKSEGTEFIELVPHFELDFKDKSSSEKLKNRDLKTNQNRRSEY